MEAEAEAEGVEAVLKLTASLSLKDTELKRAEKERKSTLLN